MARQVNYILLTLRSLRATARFLGSVLFLMIIMFAFGEGIPNPFALSFAEAITFFSFVIMLGGLIAAWRYEGIGGLIVLVGYLIFAIANPGSVMIDMVSIFPLTGLLFLIYWWVLEKQFRSKRNPRSDSK
ncbi:MAG: hypothetical protein V3W18_07480 [candidate division Zixibacteria bacterium]